MNNKRYPVITLEGGDGSGKTTIIEKLREYLDTKGIDYMITREPGGVRISESIREIILDKENTEMDSRTEALLYAAARRQHLIEKVIPAVEANKLVIFDRFVDSSVVYQGYVRGIGMKEVYDMNLFATDGFTPDITFYLDVRPEIGLARINANKDREINRLDLEGATFHKKVREGYLKLAEENVDRIIIIDGERSIQEVYAEIVNNIEKILGEC